MYSEDENYAEGGSNMICHPISPPTCPEHHYEGINHNNRSQSHHVNSDPNAHRQQRNYEHGTFYKLHSPPSQSEHFQYMSKSSPCTRAPRGYHEHHDHSFYPSSRCNTYSGRKSDEWNFRGHPSQPRPNRISTLPLITYR